MPCREVQCVGRGEGAPPYAYLAAGESGASGTPNIGVKKQEDAPASSCFLMSGFESEALDDINDFRTDALLSLHGGGADMSGRLENVPVAHF